MSQGIFYEMALAKVSAISSLRKEKVAISLRRAVNRNFMLEHILNMEGTTKDM